MDIAAARTFLEIVKTGSFVRAAANLNITQTAVSARVRVLEAQLDRQIFVRNKAGAKLTPAGEQFLRYATTLVQVWERARHQVAMPVGRDKVVTIGGEHSLWDPLLRDWLVWMRTECTDVAVRAQIDVADRLVDQVQEGVLDLAVVYEPPLRTGLVCELLLEESLVAVTTDPTVAERLCLCRLGPRISKQPSGSNPGRSGARSFREPRTVGDGLYSGGRRSRLLPNDICAPASGQRATDPPRRKAEILLFDICGLFAQSR